MVTKNTDWRQASAKASAAIAAVNGLASALLTTGMSLSGQAAQIGTLQSALATMPLVQLATTAPMAEAKTASAGEAPTASRGDHVHPRLTATASGTLNSSGEATIVFTRTFVAKPAVLITLVEAADGQPVVFKVKTWARARARPATTRAASSRATARSGYRNSASSVESSRRSSPA